MDPYWIEIGTKKEIEISRFKNYIAPIQETADNKPKKFYRKKPISTSNKKKQGYSTTLSNNYESLDDNV